MIADEACWERGCACHDSRDSPGVELVRKREWVGLTEAETDAIDKANWDADDKSWGIHSFARAIEAKLKEKNSD